MKRCKKCKNQKPAEEFYKTATGAQTTNCKICSNLINKEYREKNREAISARKKSHYSENRNTVLARNKQYREKNREFVLEMHKSYSRSNREKILAYNREYRKKMLLTDPLARPIQAIRSRLYKFCKLTSMDKQFKTLDSLGITQSEFKIYIESLFADGMTWENYGYGNDKWSIDHIKPLRIAKTIEDVFALNHYTNLQPMWNPENFSKGGKYQEQ